MDLTNASFLVEDILNFNAERMYDAIRRYDAVIALQQMTRFTIRFNYSTLKTRERL